MAKSTTVAIAISSVATLTAAVVTAAGGFVMWALALNGFMGQERAVDYSMYTYIALAVISALVGVILSGLAVWYLSGKRGWHPVGSAVLSIAVFATAIGALHAGSVLVSAVVADQMRTNRR